MNHNFLCSNYISQLRTCMKNLSIYTHTHRREPVKTCSFDNIDSKPECLTRALYEINGEEAKNSCSLRLHCFPLCLQRGSAVVSEVQISLDRLVSYARTNRLLRIALPRGGIGSTQSTSLPTPHAGDLVNPQLCSKAGLSSLMHWRTLLYHSVTAGIAHFYTAGPRFSPTFGSHTADAGGQCAQGLSDQLHLMWGSGSRRKVTVLALQLGNELFSRSPARRRAPLAGLCAAGFGCFISGQMLTTQPCTGICAPAHGISWLKTRDFRGLFHRLSFPMKLLQETQWDLRDLAGISTRNLLLTLPLPLCYYWSAIGNTETTTWILIFL